MEDAGGRPALRAGPAGVPGVIGFLLRLLPWWVWALILSGLAACAGIAVWRTATAVADARWLAGQAAAHEQRRNQERIDAERARAASLDFERWRRDQSRRHTEVANALSIALRTPISCPSELAAVVVPAAAVEQLRRAGDDRPGPDAHPGELVR